MKLQALLLGHIVCAIGCCPNNLFAQGLRPTNIPMSTRWVEEVSATNSHPEYPRPTLVRSEWLNLNGQWECGITHRDQTNSRIFDQKILVPFPVESQLSGVKRLFTEQQRLWYRRTFTIPSQWQGRRIMLHFEAVDWETKVWLNGHELGMHQGGYDRFSFDITDNLKPEGERRAI